VGGRTVCACLDAEGGDACFPGFRGAGAIRAGGLAAIAGGRRFHLGASDARHMTAKTMLAAARMSAAAASGWIFCFMSRCSF